MEDNRKPDQDVEKKIRERMVEEKRNAIKRQEEKMAEQRALAKAKKEFKGLPPRPVPPPPIAQQPTPLPQVETPLPISTPTLPPPPQNEPLPDGHEFVTKQKVSDMAFKINQSFKWLEGFVTAQNQHNAKVDKFIIGLTTLIEEYNKK